MKKFAAAFGLLLSLAACSGDLPPPASMAQRLPPKIGLNVQSVALADRSEIQTNSPYRSAHLSPTINDAIRQWATDRLQATGQTGQAIMLIKDASLTSQTLPKQTGIDSWFKRQQGMKYTGHAEVSIEANGRPGFATANANATRSVSLPEDPTDMEKQDAYYTLLTGLMKDLNANLDSAIQTHMSSFITTAPVADTPVVTTTPMVTAPVATAPMPMTETSESAMMDSSPLVVTDKPVMTAPSAASVALPPAPPTPAAVVPPTGRAVIPLSGK